MSNEYNQTDPMQSSGRGSRKRRPLPNEQSGRHFIKEGIKTCLLSLLYIAIVVAINILVLRHFKWNIWSLYWLNAGFIIILPIFRHFDGIEVQVTELNSGRQWTETQGLRGIIIGVVVLLVVTLLVVGLIDTIFPPYSYMGHFFLLIVPAFVSGGHIFKRSMDVYAGVTMIIAGRRLVKDANAPRVQAVMDVNAEKCGKISLIATLSMIAICVLAIVVQYLQVLFVTPMIRKKLDVLTVYRQSEDNIPYSDDVILQSRDDGEFSKFSTEFETAVSETLDINGVNGQYDQSIHYRYNYKEKKWEVNEGSPQVVINTANISGTWAPSGDSLCTDNDAGAENFKVTLDIAELTTEKTRGTVRFFSGEELIFESTFTGDVTVEDGTLITTATMSKGYNVFFDVGCTELTFKYQAFNESIVLSGYFEGYLMRK